MGDECTDISNKKEVVVCKTFARSKSTIETLEKGVKYIQS